MLNWPLRLTIGVLTSTNFCINYPFGKGWTNTWNKIIEFTLSLQQEDPWMLKGICEEVCFSLNVTDEYFFMKPWYWFQIVLNWSLKNLFSSALKGMNAFVFVRCKHCRGICIEIDVDLQSSKKNRIFIFISSINRGWSQWTTFCEHFGSHLVSVLFS